MAGPRTIFSATRPGFFPASLIPALLGAAEAWRVDRAFHPGYLALTLIAVLCFHAGMNVVNDYCDYLNNTDNINNKALPPFTGGSGLIQSGKISPSGTLVLAIVLLATGSAVGLYLAITVSPILFLIGGAGLVSGVFYSAPPVFLAGRGLGELVVGLDFGLLTVLGSFIVQTGGAAPGPVFASLPISLLISAILYLNEFPDVEADKICGKRNLVVRLAPKWAVMGFYVIISSAYICLIMGIILGYLPVLALAALLSTPLALRSAAILKANPEAGPGLIPAIKSIILAHISCGLILIISDILI